MRGRKSTVKVKAPHVYAPRRTKALPPAQVVLSPPREDLIPTLDAYHAVKAGGVCDAQYVWDYFKDWHAVEVAPDMNASLLVELHREEFTRYMYWRLEMEYYGYR